MVDKIFICHYSKLKNRRQGMLRQKEQYHFCDIEWITEEVVKEYNIHEYYNSSAEFFDRRLASDFGKQYHLSYQKLTRGEIEITLQHIHTYRKMVEENLSRCIIFEDDVVLKENYSGNLARCLHLLPKDFDIFYFGQGCFQEQEFDEKEVKETYRDPPFTVFRKENRQSRYSDSYLISRKAAEKLLDTMIPFCFPIDWELNYQQFIHDMNIYWVYPTLTYQGSGFGLYKSNLKWRKWRQFFQRIIPRGKKV
jgi:GR25 family glycosyltransferase involved in LPS biosynthesis